VIFSKIIPITSLKKASKVFPLRKNNCLSAKKPKVPTPPKVIWIVLKSIHKEPYQESTTLLSENLAFIGRGQGCSGLILLTKDDVSRNEFRSEDPTINTNKNAAGIKI